MSSLITAGILFVFVGIILLFIGSIGSMFRGARGDGPRSKVKGGGIIMLGPIPIVFGSDRGSVKTLVLLALVLMAAYLLMVVVMSLLL
ncbi:TIGR00304 family membrane protein [Methanolobus chelungpuianus]|uniref:TIGR00304 family protein n=1 Tax=Methanolobus chelungpuianus TaxID=502115 RepID=A0AAE3HB09_9EURY|nr:DUF131 domain-containing protein [Methanolobus chelungpuianus]MCQ6962804.1 hypothetical protein [Methanolobus chelungpuianus]